MRADQFVAVLRAQIRRDVHRQHVGWRQPRVGVRETHGFADEQSGTDDEDERQRDFRGGERVAKRGQADPAASELRSSRQPARHIDRGGGQRRRRSKDQPCCRGHKQHEDEHAPVHGDVGGSRNERTRQGHDNGRAPQGECEARDGSGQRQHHAFREELPDQTSAPRAQGHANGRLASSHRPAHEQQVRHVGARRQQHQADCAEQQQQSRPDRSDNGVGKRCQFDADAGTGLGKVRGEPLRDCRKIGSRSGPVDTGLEPANGEVHRRTRVCRWIGNGPERSRRTGERALQARRVVRKAERFRHDADDCEAAVFGNDNLSQRSRRAREPPPCEFR